MGIEKPRITVLEGHEAAFGQLGQASGGAGEVAYHHAEKLYHDSLLNTFITRDLDKIGHHIDEIPPWTSFLQHPPISDQLLQKKEYFDKYIEEIVERTNNRPIYTHYYRSGLALLHMKDHTPHAHMGHTWLRSTNLNNPGRSHNEYRDMIEMKILQDSSIHIIIQTNAELEDIVSLYAKNNPSFEKKIREKTRIVRLGIPDEYFDLQTFSHEEIKIYRHLAKMRFVSGEGFSIPSHTLQTLEKQILDTHDPLMRKAIGLFSIGRIAEGKGQLEQILAFEKAMDNNPDHNAVLVIVGGFKEGDTYYHRVIQAIQDIKNPNIRERIHLVGPYADTEIFQMFLRSGVFLGNSFRESWHLSAVKAAAAGFPLVVTDDSIRREIFQSGTQDEPVMQYIPAGDIDALAKAMIALSSSDCLQEAALKNHRAVEKYTWEQSYKDLKKALTSFGMIE